MTKEAEQRNRHGSSIVLGVAIGVAIGAALDSMGAGIALGYAIGVAIDMVRRRQGRDEDREGDG